MINNKVIVDKLMNNNKTAQVELINKFNSRIFLYFRMRIKGIENYEDLVQEVFTSFFECIKKDKIKDDKYIAPFLFGIAKRVVYNYFYRQKRVANIERKVKKEFDLIYLCDFFEEDKIETEKINHIIRDLIDRLPEIDKTILREFYLKENNIGEVADLIGKTKHYVSVRKKRALKKIKNEILKRKILYTI